MESDGQINSKNDPEAASLRETANDALPKKGSFGTPTKSSTQTVVKMEADDSGFNSDVTYNSDPYESASDEEKRAAAAAAAEKAKEEELLSGGRGRRKKKKPSWMKEGTFVAEAGAAGAGAFVVGAAASGAYGPFVVESEPEAEEDRAFGGGGGAAAARAGGGKAKGGGGGGGGRPRPRSLASVVRKSGYFNPCPGCQGVFEKASVMSPQQYSVTAKLCQQEAWSMDKHWLYLQKLRQRHALRTGQAPPEPQGGLRPPQHVQGWTPPAGPARRPPRAADLDGAPAGSPAPHLPAAAAPAAAAAAAGGGGRPAVGVVAGADPAMMDGAGAAAPPGPPPPLPAAPSASSPPAKGGGAGKAGKAPARGGGGAKGAGKRQSAAAAVDPEDEKLAAEAGKWAAARAAGDGAAAAAGGGGGADDDGHFNPTLAGYGDRIDAYSTSGEEGEDAPLEQWVGVEPTEENSGKLDPKDGARPTPVWARCLAPVGSMAANHGNPIKCLIKKACWLARDPDVVRALQRCVSPEVFRSNSAGAAKRGAQVCLHRYGGRRFRHELDRYKRRRRNKPKAPGAAAPSHPSSKRPIERVASPTGDAAAAAAAGGARGLTRGEREARRNADRMMESIADVFLLSARRDAGLLKVEEDGDRPDRGGGGAASASSVSDWTEDERTEEVEEEWAPAPLQWEGQPCLFPRAAFGFPLLDPVLGSKTVGQGRPLSYALRIENGKVMKALPHKDDWGLDPTSPWPPGKAAAAKPHTPAKAGKVPARSAKATPPPQPTPSLGGGGGGHSPGGAAGAAAKKAAPVAKPTEREAADQLVAGMMAERAAKDRLQGNLAAMKAEPWAEQAATGAGTGAGPSGAGAGAGADEGQGAAAGSTEGPEMTICPQYPLPQIRVLYRYTLAPVHVVGGGLSSGVGITSFSLPGQEELRSAGVQGNRFTAVRFWKTRKPLTRRRLKTVKVRRKVKRKPADRAGARKGGGGGGASKGGGSIGGNGGGGASGSAGGGAGADKQHPYLEPGRALLRRRRRKRETLLREQGIDLAAATVYKPSPLLEQLERGGGGGGGAPGRSPSARKKAAVAVAAAAPAKLSAEERALGPKATARDWAAFARHVRQVRRATARRRKLERARVGCAFTRIGIAPSSSSSSSSEDEGEGEGEGVNAAAVAVAAEVEAEKENLGTPGQQGSAKAATSAGVDVKKEENEEKPAANASEEGPSGEEDKDANKGQGSDSNEEGDGMEIEKEMVGESGKMDAGRRGPAKERKEEVAAPYFETGQACSCAPGKASRGCPLPVGHLPMAPATLYDWVKAAGTEGKGDPLEAAPPPVVAAAAAAATAAAGGGGEGAAAAAGGAPMLRPRRGRRAGRGVGAAGGGQLALLLAVSAPDWQDQERAALAARLAELDGALRADAPVPPFKPADWRRSQRRGGPALRSRREKEAAARRARARRQRDLGADSDGQYTGRAWTHAEGGRAAAAGGGGGKGGEGKGGGGGEGGGGGGGGKHPRPKVVDAAAADRRLRRSGVGAALQRKIRAYREQAKALQALEARRRAAAAAARAPSPAASAASEAAPSAAAAAAVVALGCPRCPAWGFPSEGAVRAHLLTLCAAAAAPARADARGGPRAAAVRALTGRGGGRRRAAAAAALPRAASVASLTDMESVLESVAESEGPSEATGSSSEGGGGSSSTGESDASFSEGEEEAAAASGAEEGGGTGEKPPPPPDFGPELVGRRAAVFHKGAWRRGQLMSHRARSGRHLVEFDDGSAAAWCLLTEDNLRCKGAQAGGGGGAGGGAVVAGGGGGGPARDGPPATRDAAAAAAGRLRPCKHCGKRFQKQALGGHTKTCRARRGNFPKADSPPPPRPPPPPPLLVPHTTPGGERTFPCKYCGRHYARHALGGHSKVCKAEHGGVPLSADPRRLREAQALQARRAREAQAAAAAAAAARRRRRAEEEDEKGWGGEGGGEAAGGPAVLRVVLRGRAAYIRDGPKGAGVYGESDGEGASPARSKPGADRGNGAVAAAAVGGRGAASGRDGGKPAARIPVGAASLLAKLVQVVDASQLEEGGEGGEKAGSSPLPSRKRAAAEEGGEGGGDDGDDLTGSAKRQRRRARYPSSTGDEDEEQEQATHALSTMVPCKFCGRKIRKRGLFNHEKHCQGKDEVREEPPGEADRRQRTPCAHCGKAVLNNGLPNHERYCASNPANAPPSSSSEQEEEEAAAGQEKEEEEEEEAWGGSGGDRIDGRAPCKYCGELYARHGVTQHEKTCARNAGADAFKVACGRCGRLFSRNGVANHERVCQGAAGDDEEDDASATAATSEDGGEKEAGEGGSGGGRAGGKKTPKAPCAHCGRRFWPNGLVNHERTCSVGKLKGEEAAAAAAASGGGGGDALDQDEEDAGAARAARAARRKELAAQAAAENEEGKEGGEEEAGGASSKEEGGQDPRCQYCGEEKAPRGLPVHERYCDRNPENQKKAEEDEDGGEEEEDGEAAAAAKGGRRAGEESDEGSGSKRSTPLRCRHCAKLLSPQGLSNHERACESQQQGTKAEAEGSSLVLKLRRSSIGATDGSSASGGASKEATTTKDVATDVAKEKSNNGEATPLEPIPGPIKPQSERVFCSLSRFGPGAVVEALRGGRPGSAASAAAAGAGAAAAGSAGWEPARVLRARDRSYEVVYDADGEEEQVSGSAARDNPGLYPCPRCGQRLPTRPAARRHLRRGCPAQATKLLASTKCHRIQLNRKDSGKCGACRAPVDQATKAIVCNGCNAIYHNACRRFAKSAKGGYFCRECLPAVR